MNKIKNDERVPVTVLTGFLGSGKTTLLNRILTENHGKRIAVIENEFGEVGVDQALVIGADEEIFEMNNGCICCTVRGDLIRILGNLMKRKDKFDYIMIETTGLADPGPVAQTFCVDDEMKSKLRLDAIVTLVDAKHIIQHIDDSSEAREQIAFADVLLLNKTDLVKENDLAQLEARVRKMNAAAKIYRTQNASIEMDKILNVNGFNLHRALEVDPAFLEPDYPYEWSGVFNLEAKAHEIVLHKGPDDYMNCVVLPCKKTTKNEMEALEMDALNLFSEKEKILKPGQSLTPGRQLYQLKLDGKEMKFILNIEKQGDYCIFTQHQPEEFKTSFRKDKKEVAPKNSKIYNPDHVHDNSVTSVGINMKGDLDGNKLDEWLGELLRNKGQDIFRMKGVLSIKDENRRFVFQGVHMLFDGTPSTPWGSDTRSNIMIFIGRNLDRKSIVRSFKSCLVN